MLSRDRIVAGLAAALAEAPAARAAWLGGSDANGRTDAFSDIDLVMLVDDDGVEEVFRVVERALENLSPIELSFRHQPAMWPGMDQGFYRLRDAGPHLLIDFAAIRLSTPASGRFLERERHGVPRVLFDHDSLIRAAPIDRGAHEGKILARLADLRVRFPMFLTLTERAIERGQVVDAVHFYMGMTLRPLIDVLRIAHCPDRFDFGPRYLWADLPAEAAAAVERLSLVPDLATLGSHLREAEGLFRATLEAIDRSGKFREPAAG